MVLGCVRHPFHRLGQGCSPPRVAATTGRHILEEKRKWRRRTGLEASCNNTCIALVRHDSLIPPPSPLPSSLICWYILHTHTLSLSFLIFATVFVSYILWFLHDFLGCVLFLLDVHGVCIMEMHGSEFFWPFLLLSFFLVLYPLLVMNLASKNHAIHFQGLIMIIQLEKKNKTGYRHGEAYTSLCPEKGGKTDWRTTPLINKKQTHK